MNMDPRYVRWNSSGRVWIKDPINGKIRKVHKAFISDITEGNLAMILNQYAYPYMIGVLSEDMEHKIEVIQAEYTRRKAHRKYSKSELH